MSDPYRLWAPPTPERIERPPGGGGGPSGGGGFYGGPGPSSGGGGGPSGGGAVRQELPPDYFPPAGATYWALEGFQSVAGPTAVPVELASFEVPQSAMAILRDMEVSTAPMVLTDRITFTLEIDGSPVPGWVITLTPRGAAFASLSYLPDMVRIAVRGGSEIRMMVARTDGNTSQLAVSARGWHYPESLHQRFYGGRA